MKNFQNKVVIITGAASGIGAALSMAFAEKGALLALNDINEMALKEHVKSLNLQKEKVFYQSFDVSDEIKIKEFYKGVKSCFGKAHILINNAGVAQTDTPLSRLSVEDFKWLFEINFFATLYAYKAFYPLLCQHEEASVVNVSSIFGLMGIPGLSSYSSSKAALKALSSSIRLEEKAAQSGIAVTCVLPGGVKTNIARSAKGISKEKADDFERLLRCRPEQAAKKIINGIQRKKSTVYIGVEAWWLKYNIFWIKSWLPTLILRRYRQLINSGSIDNRG